MNKKTSLVAVVLSCLSFYLAKGQVSADISIPGTWKGTSICQVKNSPCHDEVVVYHISKAPGTDSFSVMANKIVNAKEEEMGTIPFKFDRKNNQLISTAYGLWTFTVKGNDMEGTLVYKGELYRIIKVSKQPSH